MFFRYKHIITTAIFLLYAAGICHAGDTLKTFVPKAVLVQLPSEYNRISAMQKQRMYHEMKIVEKDGENVRAAMINDFQMNFKDCPVYYYIDTNIELITQKKFDGVLLNEDGTPAKNIIINSSSTDYLIAYYGYPKPQSRVNSEATDSEALYGDPYGRGLVILNSNMKQVNYFYKLGGLGEMLGKRKPNTPTFYKSRDYEIEYYPFAKLFNDELLDRYGRRRWSPH